MVPLSVPEFKALISPYGLSLKEIFKHELREEDFPEHEWQINYELFKQYPFVYIEVPTLEILYKIMERAILIKAILTPLGEAITYEELIHNIDEELMNSILSQGTFAFNFETVNHHISHDEQNERIKQFDKLKTNGKVNLKNPDKRIWIMELYEKIQINKEKCEEYAVKLKKIFFGIEILKRPKCGKMYHAKFELKKRTYLGSTSTVHDLAFIMANQALAFRGDFIMDPFVGTGSLLLPASHFGCVCFGCDIDWRVLQGFAVGYVNKNSENYKANKDFVPDYWTNFKQYNLEMPEIIRVDTTTNRFRWVDMFDAMICDPPYGIRAAGRSSKSTFIYKKAKEEFEEEKAIEGETIVPLEPVTCENIVEKLFDLCDKMLKINGRLVLLYPHLDYEKPFTGFDAPKRKNYKLIDAGMNMMNKYAGRVLLTYMKID